MDYEILQLSEVIQKLMISIVFFVAAFILHESGQTIYKGASKAMKWAMELCVGACALAGIFSLLLSLEYGYILFFK